MNRPTLATTAFSLISAIAFAQAPNPDAMRMAELIKPENLSKHLYILASDSLEGRETGKPGQKMAAGYISNHFNSLNLAPVATDKEGNKSYFQQFDLSSNYFGDGYIICNNKRKDLFQHFYAWGNMFTDGVQTLELVYLGYGVEETGYSDFTDVDITGKAVVVLEGSPDAFKNPVNLNDKIKNVRSKGAALVLVARPDGDFEKIIKTYRMQLSAPSLGLQGKKESNQTLYIPIGLAADFFRKKPKKFIAETEKMYASGKKPASSVKPAKITCLVERKEAKVPTENVLGYLEGTDKKDEVIVITGHYDHLGKQGDKIYNGADDDGSGTVGVLEIASAFSAARDQGLNPRRSILFMTVTGEEKGLLGSRFYVENPIFPLEQTVANLNIDMIGRTDNNYKEDSNYIYIIGSDKLSTELHEISESVNNTYTQIKLDYRYNDEKDPNRFYYRSDHYNFAKNNIPVIFYFSGTHPDYHRDTDTPDKIQYGKMANVVKLVFHTAWELSNRDTRIEADKAKKEKQ